MTPERFQAISSRYGALKIGILGDFCLDRYLEIDPRLAETSIETGLEVYNVTRVRSQPGGAGTILNNLAALGVGEAHAIGFCGEDGEGYELMRSLASHACARLDPFLQTPLRRTFTYTKPLLVEPGKAPRELNRLDMKNWGTTPLEIERRIAQSLEELFEGMDALIVLDQVDRADTGVVTRLILERLGAIADSKPEKLVLADSRRSLREFPRVSFKMNRAELGLLTQAARSASVSEAKAQAAALAAQRQRSVFVTLSEEGIVAAAPSGQAWHQPAHPVRGEIDIVGAGDAVTANLAAALASGAAIPEAMEISMAASSIVIHQLGSTGSASPQQIAELLFPPSSGNPRP